MQPDIAAEVLHFLSRRDLDKTCAVSKWLDAMIAQCCETYPLRSVARMQLFPRGNDFLLNVSGFREGDASSRYVFGSGAILRHSHVDVLELGHRDNNTVTTLSSFHWSTLIDAIRGGVVRRLTFTNVDFSAVKDDAFMVAIGGFVTDELLRSNPAKALLQLRIVENDSDAPHRLSEDAILDFFFPTDAAPGRQQRNLELEYSMDSNMFLANLFARILSSPSRPTGSLRFIGAPKQRGLSAYAHLMAPAGTHAAKAVYRFPLIGDAEKSYELKISEQSASMKVRLRVA